MVYNNIKDDSDYWIRKNEEGSVTMSERFYLKIAREAKAKADEEFEKRAGEEWKKGREAIRKHRDYDWNKFIINT